MAFTDTQIKLDEFAVGDTRCIEIGDLQVGLFRLPEGLFAIENMCPHRGAPLHDGHVTNGMVVCPWHQWQFNLKDGVCKNIPNVKVAAYPVEVRDGAIWVNLEEGASK
jgi:NAD(P)H-dependent nitrite reductase small subunit